jgi:hypothetical protein
MLLIQICLRPLMPAASGMELSAARATPAQSAMTSMATRHRRGLAPIHAPPRLLPLS